MGTFHIQASRVKEDMATGEKNMARKQVQLQSIIGKLEKSRGSPRLGEERRARSPGACSVD